MTGKNGRIRGKAQSVIKEHGGLSTRIIDKKSLLEERNLLSFWILFDQRVYKRAIEVQNKGN